MDAVITGSGDRRYAAIAEGNISSGPLNVYDFKKKELKNVADLRSFHYEIACSRKAKYFASPNKKGLDIYDAKGRRLSLLEGKPVICAAYHPQSNFLYVMRHGEVAVQEYRGRTNKVAHTYPLDKPLVIRGDRHDSIIGHIHPVGRNRAMANFRRVSNVNYSTFRSGRLKVSATGKKLFAVVPSGVYMFQTKTKESAQGSKPKRRINVIETETEPSKGK